MSYHLEEDKRLLLLAQEHMNTGIHKRGCPATLTGCVCGRDNRTVELFNDLVHTLANHAQREMSFREMTIQDAKEEMRQKIVDAVNEHLKSVTDAEDRDAVEAVRGLISEVPADGED